MNNFQRIFGPELDVYLDTIFGTRGWTQSGVSSGCCYPKACLASTGTDLVQFTWSVVKTRGYFYVNEPGLLEATSRSPQRMRMHFADARYVPTTYYWSHENEYGSQAVGFQCRTWWHALHSRYTTSWSAWLRDNYLPIPSEGSSLRTSVSRSSPVWFFSLFWTRPGPDWSSEISFLGKNRTGLGKTGLHRSGLRSLNRLRPRPV